MPPRRSPALPPSLTDGDVDTLRARLSAGEAPRVVVRSGSAAVPVGTRGTVVRLGDPTQDEYVVVRIARDEVPFSPSELSLPGAKPVAVVTPIRPARQARSSPTAPPPTIAAGAPAAPSPVADEAAGRGRSRTRRSGAERPATRSPGPMTVTLHFAEGAWTAEASRGARRLARPAPLRPGAVSALAAHVDDEGLRAALDDTVEACRAAVEDRAARLRAQLADAESTLREYDPKPRRGR